MNDCSLTDFFFLNFSFTAQPAQTTPAKAPMAPTPSVAMVNDTGSAISTITSCSLGGEEVGAKRSAGQEGMM